MPDTTCSGVPCNITHCFGECSAVHRQWDCRLQGTPTNYTANLTSEALVIPVNTSAHGDVYFSIIHHLHRKDDFAVYTITLYDVNHLTEVDLRQAHAGQDGDKIATLWGPSPGGLNGVRSLIHLRVMYQFFSTNKAALL